MEGRSHVKRNMKRFPILLSGVFIAAAIGFVFRRSFLGDMKTQSDELYKGEDVEGKKLLRDAIMESWTAETKKK